MLCLVFAFVVAWPLMAVDSRTTRDCAASDHPPQHLLGSYHALSPVNSIRPRLSPSGAALREARLCWGQALIAAKPELEARVESDPDTLIDRDAWHRLMQRDPGGSLHRAKDAALRARALARTPEETYQATVWLAMVECDLGRHEEELKQARRLMVLQPRSAISLGALRRAAQCTGHETLAREADAALQELETVSGTHPGR